MTHAVFLYQGGLSMKLQSTGQQPATESAVRVHDDHFRQVLDASPNLAYIQDIYGHYVYVNDVWCEYFHRSSVDTVGKRAIEIHTPETAAEMDRTNRLVMAAGGLVQIEETQTDTEGKQSHFAVSKFSFTDERGDLLIATIAVDITHYINAQDALRTERDFSSAVIDAVGALVIVTDSQGAIERINLASESALGYFSREVIGRVFWDVFCHAQDMDAIKEHFATACRDQSQSCYIVNCMARDGTLRTLGLTFVAVNDAQGQVSHVIISGMNLTERQRAFRELAEAKTEAEEANLAKTRFLASVSHELRTPMTALVGHLDLLEEPDLDAAQKEHSLRSARRNADYLIELINDFLDLSRIESGTLTIQPTICSPLQIVAEAASLMRRRALEKGVKFGIEYVGPIPETMTTDPMRLKQILVNLLGNAVKFTQTGSVRLVVRMMNIRNNEPALQFQVIDTGVGLTTLQISQLFVPFSQTDGSASNRFGGTGLGLTICKKLAESLGGGIEVESIPGMSTTFSVTVTTGSLNGVRLIVNAREAGLSVNPGSAQNSRDDIRLNGRILLAEDGPDNAYLLTLVLKHAGATVEHAENGRIARRRAMDALRLDNPYQLIFMDMQMPEMDGYTATRLLRKQGYQLPIVALTAHAMPGDREKCIAAGCNDYLSKPVDTVTLLRTAALWIGRASEINCTIPSLGPDTGGAADHCDKPHNAADLVQLTNRIYEAYQGGHWGNLTSACEDLTRYTTEQQLVHLSVLAQDLLALAQEGRGQPNAKRLIAELRSRVKQIQQTGNDNDVYIDGPDSSPEMDHGER